MRTETDSSSRASNSHSFSPIDKSKEKSPVEQAATRALQDSSLHPSSHTQYTIARILSAACYYLANKIAACWNYFAKPGSISSELSPEQQRNILLSEMQIERSNYVDIGEVEQDVKREIDQKSKSNLHIPKVVSSDFDRMMRDSPIAKSPGELDVSFTGPQGKKTVSYEPPSPVTTQLDQSKRKTEMQIIDFHSRIMEAMPEEVREQLILSPEEREKLGLKPGEHPWFNIITNLHTINGWGEAPKALGAPLFGDYGSPPKTIPFKSDVSISAKGLLCTMSKVCTTGLPEHRGKPFLVTVTRFIPMAALRKGSYASPEEMQEGSFTVTAIPISDAEIDKRIASRQYQKGPSTWMSDL